MKCFVTRVAMAGTSGPCENEAVTLTPNGDPICEECAVVYDEIVAVLNMLSGSEPVPSIGYRSRLN